MAPAPGQSSRAGTCFRTAAFATTFSGSSLSSPLVVSHMSISLRLIRLDFLARIEVDLARCLAFSCRGTPCR